MARFWSSGLRRGEGRSFGTTIALVAAVGLALTIGGCGGSSGGSSGGSGSSTASKLQPPASAIAINNASHLAYVPDGTDVNGDGVIAVVNLAANPNKTNPVTKTITLTHVGYIVSTVYDPVDNLLLVASGENNPGYLDVFNAKTLTPVTGSPFSYPSGYMPGNTGGIGLVSGKLYGASKDSFAILSMCDTSTCSNGLFQLFDLTTGQGAGTNLSANYPEYVATNFNSGLTVNAGFNDLTGQIGIIDGANGVACVLSDSNLPGDNDSAALDPSTDIVVVSNEDGTATVLNLNGGTFAAGPPCTFTEAGTLPNSVQMTGLSTDLEGGVANPKTHQAFLVADGAADLALISLPTSAVTQLSASMLSAQSTTMPNDPNGSTWSPFSNPSYVAVDPKTNKAYTTSDGFLAQVDLAKFKSDPTTISAALPTSSKCGSSYGVTTTTAACNNAGNAVVFYPLPAP